jgi:predicted permease
VRLAFRAEDRAPARRYSHKPEQLARRAPGPTLAHAGQRLEAQVARNIAEAGPLKSALVNAGYRSEIKPLADDLVRNVRPALQLLWGGVACLLLIAAVNITNLSLARASGRMREVATRHALGAARSRVVRQLVTETTLLTLIGSGLGLALGYWSLGALKTLGLADIPRAHEIRMDAMVVLFMLGSAVALGVIVGAVPAMHLAGLNLNLVLREDSRTGTAGRGARAIRSGLVVAQVALAFVLLTGAGLLMASFRALLNVNPGFTAEHVLTGRVSPLKARYPDENALRSYTSRVLERIRALPGIEAAGGTSFLPFSWDSSSSVIIPEGYVMAPGESVVSPNQLYVTPGYLEALRVPLKQGRFFTESDTVNAPGVVIVDEQLARRFWPNADPVGRRMYLPQSPDDVAKPGPKVTWLQVVGVVGSIKLKALVEQGENARVGAFYVPAAQDPPRTIALAIRSKNEDAAATKAAVERAIAEIDPEIELFDSFAMHERVDRSLDTRRAPMLLLGMFGGVALLLAALGIYGVLAYQVGQRTREIGIRMALGSDAKGILRLVLREAVGLVLIGLAAGMAAAIGFRGVIASQLYGVGAFDPRVIVAATFVLCCRGPHSLPRAGASRGTRRSGGDAATLAQRFSDGRVDLVHQPLIFQCAFEAHLRLTAGADRRGEIRIHRAIAANVPEAGQDHARQPFAAHENDHTVGFERDDAAAAHELGEAKATEERWHFSRVVERADRAVVVRERHEHALRAPIGTLTRRRRPEAVDLRDARAEAARDMQPVDAFLEEGIASSHGLVIAPVVGGLQP